MPAYMPVRAYDRLVLTLLQIYALLGPVAYVRIGGGAFSIVDLLGPAAFVLMLARGLRGINLFFALYVAYVLCALISVMTSSLPRMGLANLLLAIRLFSISAPFALVFFLRHPQEWMFRSLFRWTLAGLGIAVTIGVLLHMMGIQVQDSQRLWISHGAQIVGVATRAGGIVGNSTAYGLQIGLFAALLLGATTLNLVRSMPAVLFGWLMVAMALAFSSSRSGMLMTLIFAMLITALRFRKAGRILGAFGLALVLVALYIAMTGGGGGFMGASLARLDIFNLTGMGADEVDLSGRAQTWQLMVSRMFDTPLFGYGYKGLEATLGLLIDNAFLLAWFEVGPIGFMLFLIAWLTLGAGLLIVFLAGPSPFTAVGLALWAAFVAFMQIGGANASWSGAPLAFMVMGLCLRHGQLVNAGLRRERNAAAIARLRPAETSPSSDLPPGLPGLEPRT